MRRLSKKKHTAKKMTCTVFIGKAELSSVKSRQFQRGQLCMTLGRTSRKKKKRKERKKEGKEKRKSEREEKEKEKDKEEN